MADILETLLGLGEKGPEVTAGQMAMRALVVYIAALVFIRLGDKRFMGRSSPIDMVMAIVVGSVLSRAINGQAPVIRTLFVTAFLFFLHWLFAFLTCRSGTLSGLIKGNSKRIVLNGQIDKEAMRKNHIEEHDLHESIRLMGRIADVSEVAEARLERNGQISAIKRKKPPQVLDVTSEDGTLVVRIKLSE